MRASRLVHFARLGYGARGVVYIIVGLLAVWGALFGVADATDTEGALQALKRQPFGLVMLLIVAAGLACFVAWRLIQSLSDADDHGADLKGLVIRGALLVSAITYATLAFFAFTLILGVGSSSGGGYNRATAWLMQQPFGRYLVGAVGLAVLGTGLAHFWKAFSGRFKKRLDASDAAMKVIAPISAVGLAARGIVFGIVGGFLLLAAVRIDPSQARGLNSAMSWLKDQPYGVLLFIVVAAGLAAFGAYSLIEARWRHIGRIG